MFKKSVLVASVLGVGATVSGVVLADTGVSSTYCKPGFYAGVQAGRGDTNYSQNGVLGEASTSASFNNHAAIPGSFDVDSTGAAGRIYAGYQFNPYFALEAGYTQFNKTDFTGSFGHTVNSSYVTEIFNGEVTEHAADVVGKLTVPFQYGFGAYLKAGLAFIAADRHVNFSENVNNSGAVPLYTFYTKSYQAVRPTYGVGVDYTIPNTSLDVDLSYTQIASGGGIPRADLFALGITDKFA